MLPKPHYTTPLLIHHTTIKALSGRAKMGNVAYIVAYWKNEDVIVAVDYAHYTISYGGESVRWPILKMFVQSPISNYVFRTIILEYQRTEPFPPLEMCHDD